MASEPVHPLRISKGTPGSSPTKMASGTPRPLSEIGPTEKRRNSPSWFQSTSPKKNSLGLDSSPFQSSPPDGSVTSPKQFWQSRNSNTENVPYGRPGSPSPTRRSSIERLQRASRVKNSSILALEQKQEYDPTRIPQIERPLSKVYGDSFGSFGSLALRPTESGAFRDSKTSMSPSKSPLPKSTEPTPSKDQASPTKSSLSPSKFKSSFEHESGLWSADTSINERELPAGRSLHHHAKSVTFDVAPPQINEYEMATPDISSVGTNSREGSYESVEDDDEEDSVLYDPARLDAHEDSFDASLEDTDKTPVVGPEDWRGDSPANGQQERSRGRGDVPASPLGNQPRNTSSNSNGDHRPLPPLPGAGLTRSHSASSNRASPGLAAAAERMLGAHRSLPTPPPAFASKLDIQNIGNSKMSLEERLKLMMMSDDKSAKTAAEEQRERRLRRGQGRDKFGSPSSEAEPVSILADEQPDQTEDTIGDISALNDYQLPPRISRESIMRRVNGNKVDDRESGYNFSSPAPSSSPNRSPSRSPERRVPLDPDVPIPSTEEATLDEIEEAEEENSVIITRDTEDEFDEVSEMYDHSTMGPGEDDDTARLEKEDSGSQYAEPEISRDEVTQPTAAPEEASTPRAATPSEPERKDSLPGLDQDSDHSPFSKDFESYMVPKTTELRNYPVLEPPKIPHVQSQQARPFTPEQSLTKPEYDGSGWGEPDEYDLDEPGTPDSVIRHPQSDDEDEEVQEMQLEEELPKESPAIPERVATVKAAGSKLKTRISATPSDLAAMREARRQVSHEIPDVPPIPEKHASRQSRDLREFRIEQDVSGDDFLERHPSFKNRSLTLDIDLGLSMDQDFERVIEAQKVNTDPPFVQNATQTSSQSHSARQASRIHHDTNETKDNFADHSTPKQRGYLMRQNTKLVTASDKNGDEYAKARSAGNSPVKADRPQSWVVEPWDDKSGVGSTKKHAGAGGVPPLPGHQSNAQALGQVEEEPAADVMQDSGERGRLFVKVMGVKDLDLPIPTTERTWFSLTLDNGVHCVTTAWLEMARNAPIGQEFELVVPNDLEFQLTLNVKLEKPAPTRLAPSAKAQKSKTSAFSRVFASPKKRKEIELRQREEDERAAREIKQRSGPPTVFELLSPLVAIDGSFARSYVCLKEHEHRCYGRPYMAEVSCFNEWASEEAGFASSVKSKRGDGTVVRRAPYKIGKLELQLLFVPRPKYATDDDMPKSMNSCIRELKATEERLARNWEGHLSQQGGDCPYWRRRYFKLVGTKLTAYHEATRQPRATINLSNTKRLIDDRRALTAKETTGKGGKRRRSAFAEEEEGYMFVEEGFRIRFNNGEIIDFYADTSEDKEGWMKILSDVIGRDNAEEDGSGPRSKAKWCELVLKREEQLRRRAEVRKSNSKTKSMIM